MGGRIYQVALAWWVLEKTGSAVAMGTVLILTVAPMLLFLLIGGVLVDRLPRLRLMLVSDLVRGVVVTLTAWLWITIAIAGISNIAYAAPMEVVLPFLIKDHFHADVAILGLFYSASSIGSVLAALWLGQMARVPDAGCWFTDHRWLSAF